MDIRVDEGEVLRPGEIIIPGGTGDPSIPSPQVGKQTLTEPQLGAHLFNLSLQQK